MRKVTAEFTFRARSRTRRVREKGMQRLALRVAYCEPLGLPSIYGVWERSLIVSVRFLIR